MAKKNVVRVTINERSAKEDAAMTTAAATDRQTDRQAGVEAGIQGQTRRCVMCPLSATVLLLSAIISKITAVKV